MRIVAGAAALLLSGCTLFAPRAAGTAIPADFAFIRDPDGLLAAEGVEGAQARLREIAERSGVFGIVIAAARTDEIPPPEPILDEVATLGGEAVVGFCTPEACQLQAADVASVAMGELLRRVAPAPAPAPGQGIPPGAVGLRAWLEFIGAVAVEAQEAAQP
jgi:hypothetical protein